MCPNIGGPKDTDVFYQFPSNWNRCYRPEKAQPVSQTHQSDYCLCERFSECQVFKADWDGVFPVDLKPLPVVVEAPGRSKWSRQQKWIVNSFVALAIVFVAVAFLGLHTPSGQAAFLARLGISAPGEPVRALNPTATKLPPTADQAATELSPTQTLLPSATIAPTATSEPTRTPAPTSTPFPTPGPGFGTPFGPGSGFVIHVVVVGESFTSIARKYDSSPEAISAINLTYEGASLWIGQQLVVPVGLTDAGDLPEFTIIFTTEIISLDEIARLYASEPGEIRFYNEIGESDDVPPGRWLIIPVLQTN